MHVARGRGASGIGPKSNIDPVRGEDEALGDRGERSEITVDERPRHWSPDPDLVGYLRALWQDEVEQP
jgi:hypothetical protein